MSAIPCYALMIILFLVTSPHSLLAFVTQNSAPPNCSIYARYESKASFHRSKIYKVHEDSNLVTFQSANDNVDATHHSRRDTMVALSSLLLPVFTVFNGQVRPAHAIPPQKSYSSNARNLDRLSEGDQSGGSSYDNNPSSPKSAKRRAMVGCKFNSSRGKAASLDDLSDLGERDCNLRVMGGDSEFMLRALRALDCSDCPYGIQGA